MITVELVHELPPAAAQPVYRAWIDPAAKLHVVDKHTGAELVIAWRYIATGNPVIVGETHVVIAHLHASAFALEDLAAMFERAPGAHWIEVEVESMMAELTVTVISGVAKADPRNLDDLLIELADAPNQEVRAILVDTWNDAGEAFAPAFARQVAGAPPDDNALGVLNQFLMYVEYGGGLPRAARLSPAAPTDARTITLARDDRRLGLFRELALAGGNVDTYIELVTSPRAIGLRDIWIPHPRVAEALIAAHQRRLTTLRAVTFQSPAMIDALADPTFDAVTELHVTTPSDQVAAQLAWVLRDETGFWRRRPRHLHLPASAELHAIVRAAWSDELPLAGITSGSLTLRR